MKMEDSEDKKDNAMGARWLFTPPGQIQPCEVHMERDRGGLASLRETPYTIE